VLGRPTGDALHPERLSRSFNEHHRSAVNRYGLLLPDIRLNDLRHTHATLLLTAGIHPKIVSERLGHANVSITLDAYSHAVPTLQREAASQVADLVFRTLVEGAKYHGGHKAHFGRLAETACC
jgi:integrase